MAVKTKAKTGRPSTFTQELADKICEELAMGLSIRTVCAGEGMPAISTFFRWMRDHEDFQKQYARSKEEAADAMAEDLLDIADDGHNDWMERKYGDQKTWVENGEVLGRSRLRVDTRKFLMAKMKPKRYGEKLDLTSLGKALPTPIFGGISKNNTSDDNKTDDSET